MTVSPVITYEITNSCTCEVPAEVVYDEFGSVTEYGQSPECFGDCFEDNTNTLEDVVISEWRERNNLDTEDLVRVIGWQMDWDGKAGWQDTEGADAETLIEALSLRTEWRIVFTLEGDKLTANRYSHDEPTGSPQFYFVPLGE